MGEGKGVTTDGQMTTRSRTRAPGDSNAQLSNRDGDLSLDTAVQSSSPYLYTLGGKGVYYAHVPRVDPLQKCPHVNLWMARHRVRHYHLSELVKSVWRRKY